MTTFRCLWGALHCKMSWNRSKTLNRNISVSPKSRRHIDVLVLNVLFHTFGLTTWLKDEWVGKTILLTIGFSHERAKKPTAKKAKQTLLMPGKLIKSNRHSTNGSRLHSQDMEVKSWMDYLHQDLSFYTIEKTITSDSIWSPLKSRPFPIYFTVFPS